MKVDATSLDAVKDRFDQWRNSRKRGERIPKELWDLAIKLTEFHKANLVCRVLSLNSGGLRKRMVTNSKVNIGGIKPIRVAPITLTGSSVSPTKSSSPSLVAELTTASGTLVRIFSGINYESVKALSHLMEGL